MKSGGERIFHMALWEPGITPVEHNAGGSIDQMRPAVKVDNSEKEWLYSPGGVRIYIPRLHRALLPKREAPTAQTDETRPRGRRYTARLSLSLSLSEAGLSRRIPTQASPPTAPQPATPPTAAAATPFVPLDPQQREYGAEINVIPKLKRSLQPVGFGWALARYVRTSLAPFPHDTLFPIARLALQHAAPTSPAMFRVQRPTTVSI